MQKRFRISVDGRSYDVMVEEVPLDGAVAAAPMASAVAQAAVQAVAAPPPPAQSSAPAGDGAITAPLSGVIDSIAVQVGQRVAVGDVIVVVEAMKMKTEILARHEGVVTALPVAAGQPVEAGAVLAVIG